MREIIFRGKRKENGEWVEGYYARKGVDKDTFKHFICVMTFNVNGNTYSSMFYLTDIEVAPETVGQYTDLTDKNGTKIFEGDIVHWKKVPYFVRWDSKKAEFVFANDMEADYFVVGFNEHTTMKFCKVVGNIHDNPELLQD